MKLIPNRDGIQVVEFGLLAIRETTQGIRKSLGKEIRANKKRDTQKQVQKNMFLDRAVKRGREKIIEAKNSNFIKKPLRSALTGTKNFFDGILRAAGWLLLGFIVDKLPEIVATVTKLKDIFTEIFDGLGETFNNITGTLKEVSDVIEQFKENILTGDFLDSEGKLRKEFDDLTEQVDKSKKDWNSRWTNVMDKINGLWTLGKDEVNDARERLGMSREEGEETYRSQHFSPITGIEDYNEKLAEIKQQRVSGTITDGEYRMLSQELLQLLSNYNQATFNPPPLPPIPAEYSQQPEAEAQSPVIPVPPQAIATQIVGRVGSTGRSTGPHIHIETGDGFSGMGKPIPQEVLDNIIVDGKPLSSYPVGDMLGAGRNHQGYDYPIREGAPIQLKGGLKFDSYDTTADPHGYGNNIKIIDANGNPYIIGHLSSGPESPKKGEGGPLTMSSFDGRITTPPKVMPAINVDLDDEEPIVVPFPMTNLNTRKSESKDKQDYSVSSVRSYGQSGSKNYISTIQRYNRYYT